MTTLLHTRFSRKMSERDPRKDDINEAEKVNEEMEGDHADDVVNAEDFD